MMIEKYIESRRGSLLYYSQYHHLRAIDRNLLFERTVRDRILGYEINNRGIIEPIEIGGRTHLFLHKKLDWDSNFNGVSTHKLEFILFDHDNLEVVSRAVEKFAARLLAHDDAYCFFDVPAEDIFVIQSLGTSEFRLIETRINQYFEGPQFHQYPRYKVRAAVEEDIPSLKASAVRNRNPFDRLHADAHIDNGLADSYLATFTENAIRGYSDIVLVPDEPDVPIEAFLAASYLSGDSEHLKCNLARLALAVADPVCKGWFAKLTSEFIYLCAERNIEYVMTTTQSANPRSFRSVEKLGFKLGSASHLFSLKRPLWERRELDRAFNR